MKYRTFGRTGWQVSEVGYGMWGMGDWTGSDDDESLASLQFAVQQGINFFDTAWVYGNGHSESLLGKLIKANPGTRIFTATKIPPKNKIWPSRRDFNLEDCFPPDHIRDYVLRSLENISIGMIDLIQFHVWEDGWLEDDRWVKSLHELRDEGLIRAVGISINRWEPWNGVNAVRSGLIDAVQVVYNIFDQNPEDELFPACKENKVAVIARVPFDEGTLTGSLSLQSKWPGGDWRSKYFSSKNLIASIDRAEKLKASLPSDLSMPDAALRFILSNPEVCTVIPGMRKMDHVKENISASNAGPLTADLITLLREHRWVRFPEGKPL
jgi:aryl-alcohol dehydrogenase-like predicted oxidoreductase